MPPPRARDIKVTVRGQRLMTRTTKTAIAVATALALGGCTSVQVRDDIRDGGPPLCNQLNNSLGTVAVLPEMQWRPDQKEPEARQKIAEAAIQATFRSFSCGKIAEIRPVGPWSCLPRGKVLADAAAKGIDTLVFIQVEELGPQLFISIPVLWSTFSDVKLRLRAVRTRTAETVLDLVHRRIVGGPFALRGVGPLQEEMESALRDIVGPSGD